MTRAAPGHDRTGLVRGFYFIAGGIALAIGAMSLLSILSTAASGCRLVFSQADFPTDPTVMPAGGCLQYVGLIDITVPLVVGTVLVAAALRYRGLDSASITLKALAIPTGVLAGAMPLVAYWQLHSYYRLAYGPVELAFFALGVAILALGLFAALRTAVAVRGRSASGSLR